MRLQNYLIVFLLFNFALYATNKYSNINVDPKVNIEISNIVTNGLVLANNTITFNGVEDLEIEFDVKTSYAGTNTKYFDGLLNCYYYEPNSFDNEIAQYYDNGVAPQYLFQKTEKLDYNNGIYSYTYRQKLRFKRSTVYNNGCSIVFRYRTETLTTDISNKLTYKIIGGTKTGNEPSIQATAKINLTSITYSNGSPLIDNKIIIPENEGGETGTREIDLSFNFSCAYGSKLKNGYYPGVEIQIADNLSVKTYLTTWMTPIVTDGTLTFKNLKIKSSDLSPTSYLKIRFTFQEVKIDYNCTIVRSAKPILNNIIGDNQVLALGQISKPFTYTNPYANYTIRDPKYRVSTANYDYRYATAFKWQTKTQNSEWIDIPGQTSVSYSPNRAFTENTYYRRIAYYDGQYNISNIISITRNLLSTTKRSEAMVSSSHLLNDSKPIEEKLNNENLIINIYPNPIINSLYIEGPTDIKNISIYDSFGIKSNTEKYQISKDLIEVNTSKLQSGIFLLKIDNTSFSKTLIKN